MNHPFMLRAAEVLEARGIATQRYEFPYMQAKKSRPDPPAVAEAAVWKAVAEAARKYPGLPIVAGGEGIGGRGEGRRQSFQPQPGGGGGGVFWVSLPVPRE